MGGASDRISTREANSFDPSTSPSHHPVPGAIQPTLPDRGFRVREIAVTIPKRAQRPAAPTNLRMFEDGAHPTYTTGQDIVVNWTPTSELRFGFNVTQNLECRADATVLQVLTTAGVLKGEVAFAGNAGPVTITNAQLVALLGSETDFKLRAFYSLTGLRSLNFDEITVRKT